MKISSSVRIQVALMVPVLWDCLTLGSIEAVETSRLTSEQRFLGGWMVSVTTAVHEPNFQEAKVAIFDFTRTKAPWQRHYLPDLSRKARAVFNVMTLCTF